jgi:hypothetical protein
LAAASCGSGDGSFDRAIHREVSRMYVAKDHLNHHLLYLFINGFFIVFDDKCRTGAET